MTQTHTKTLLKERNPKITKYEYINIRLDKSDLKEDYINKAVNSHDELIDTLKVIRDNINGITKEGIYVLCLEALTNAQKEG